MHDCTHSWGFAILLAISRKLIDASPRGIQVLLVGVTNPPDLDLDDDVGLAGRLSTPDCHLHPTPSRS